MRRKSALHRRIIAKTKKANARRKAVNYKRLKAEYDKINEDKIEMIMQIYDKYHKKSTE